MTSEQRRKAVSVAGLGSLEQVEHVIKQVNKSFENGETFEEFKKRVNNGEVKVDLPDYRLDNIYRSNIQSAYAHGRWQRQWLNREDRPYLMYDSLNDTRVRDSHLKLDGFIRHITDPVWQVLYVPNGYRCRCSIRALTAERAEKFGGETEDISDFKPDKGWENSPVTYNGSMDELVSEWDPDVPINTIEATTQISDIKVDITTKSQITNELKAIENWVGNDRVMSAMKRKFDDYSNPYGLSFEEYSAIRYYTAQGATQINRTLNAKVDDYSFEEIINHVQSSVVISNGLSKLPPYQGTAIRYYSADETFLKIHQKGEIVDYNSFTSSSFDDIKDFRNRNTKLVINSKNGKKIDGVSTKSDETEVLFDRDSKFLVLDVVTGKNQTTIYLDEI